MTGTIHGILVGYDGSVGSEQALAWAVREARWRGTIVTVCHAWTPRDDGAAGRAQRAGEQNLAKALRFTRSVLGPGCAQPLLAAGPAARVLCEHSADGAANSSFFIIGHDAHTATDRVVTWPRLPILLH